ncbi:MAG: Coq4 family protein [Psychroserpens sp.]|uniref:Coq4 family protein n=1 Tax=Psychroserpens sp. TaxID=2020870 RepID=UPI0030021C24
MKLLNQHRKQLIEWLFEHSQKVYTKMFKHHEPWGISRLTLLEYPKDSFGKHLGTFLEQHNYELIAKVERHDAYHTLTGFGTKVEDEIALQCLCFGNGKRSLYLYGAMILGIIILPDYCTYYYRSFTIGKHANIFHHLNYKKLLHVNIDNFRQAIFTTSQRNTLLIN